MKSRCVAFNINLGLVTLAMLCGCNTTRTNREPENPKKQLTALRVHVETTPASSTKGIEVPIFRARPVLVAIEKDAFLTEANVLAAAVQEQADGLFQIEIQLNRQGTWLLEKYSVSHRGRRIAIWCQFPEPRWLAAPVMTKVISNGRLVFTPDATREEAERIVRGLNNMARKLKTSDDW